jgi:hypothetical protein
MSALARELGVAHSILCWPLRSFRYGLQLVVIAFRIENNRHCKSSDRFLRCVKFLYSQVHERAIIFDINELL